VVQKGLDGLERSLPIDYNQRAFKATLNRI
jgi:hypothetical protein